MPLDIGSTLAREEDIRRIDVHLPHYEASVWVEYNPSKYDWRLEKLMVLDGERLPATSIREFLRSFIVDWDLTENGVKLDPKNDDHMAKLDFFFIQTPIAYAILEDISEGKALQNASQSRSPTEKPQQRKSKAPEALPANP